MFWAYGSFVGARAATLAATAILARLLVPRDFGLVALALIFIALLETLSDLGVSQALVVSKKEEELERAETVFVWSVVFGTTLALVTAAVSPLAASFFHEPALKGLLPVLGARFLLRSLGQTHYSLAQKRIDFRSRTAAELSDAVMRGCVGVGLALAGLGAWSLVIGYLAGAATLTAVLWIMVPWRPHLKPKREHLPSLMRFGGQLTGVDVLAAVQNNTDYFFIGRFLTAADLGLYTLGFRLPELLVLNLAVVTGKVLFPAFAAIDRSRLGDAFLMSLRYTLMFALPIAAGLAILAHPFTLALFGERWKDSIAPMQVLTVYALGVTIGIPAGTAYKAVGRAGVLLALGVPRTCLLIAVVAIFVDSGIVAVAACMAGVAALFAVIGLLLAMRLLAVGPRLIWSATWPTLVSTAGMAAVLIPIERGIQSPWPALMLGMVAGGATYVSLLFLFARDALVRLRDTGFPKLGSPEEAPAATMGDAVT